MVNLRGQPEVTLSGPHAQVAAADTPDTDPKVASVAPKVPYRCGGVPRRLSPAPGAERVPQALYFAIAIYLVVPFREVAGLVFRRS